MLLSVVEFRAWRLSLYGSSINDGNILVARCWGNSMFFSFPHKRPSGNPILPLYTGDIVFFVPLVPSYYGIMPKADAPQLRASSIAPNIYDFSRSSNSIWRKRNRRVTKIEDKFVPMLPTIDKNILFFKKRETLESVLCNQRKASKQFEAFTIV